MAGPREVPWSRREILVPQAQCCTCAPPVGGWVGGVWRGWVLRQLASTLCEAAWGGLSPRNEGRRWDGRGRESASAAASCAAAACPPAAPGCWVWRREWRRARILNRPPHAPRRLAAERPASQAGIGRLPPELRPALRRPWPGRPCVLVGWRSKTQQKLPHVVARPAAPPTCCFPHRHAHQHRRTARDSSI